MRYSVALFACSFVISFISIQASEVKAEVVISPESVATFKMLQKIHEAANNAQQYVRLKWDSQLDLHDGRLSHPEPNPCYNQTQQGLCVGLEYHPKYVMSPWGKIQLLTGGICTPFSFAMTTYVFFQDLHASLAVTPKLLTCIEPWYAEKKGEFQEVSFDCERKNICLRKLSKEQYSDAIGSRKIIVPREGSAIYILKGTDESKLPDPILIEHEKKFRSKDLVWAEWGALNKLTDEAKLKDLPRATADIDA